MWRLLLAAVLCAACLGGCSGRQEAAGAGTSSVGPAGEGMLLRVVRPMDWAGGAQGCYAYSLSENNRGLVTLTFPADGLFGPEGTPIAAEAIPAGALLRVQAGAVQETYPAHITSVSRVELIETGSPADAAPYEKELRQYYNP